MKKYRLIKEYPNSQPKGTLFVAQNEINAIFESESDHNSIIYWDDLWNYSEYFEEVKEPNYLITAFRSKDREQLVFNIQENGSYGKNGWSYYSLEEMLNGDNGSVKDGEWEIYSVKNSKGEEFTIGDRVVHTDFPKYPFIIKKFYTRQDSICATDNEYKFDMSISNLIKLKTPIFVSVDSKEFYCTNTDYTFFSVLPKANWEENNYTLLEIIKFPKQQWLHFTTKEARQEYIDNNKPKYSLSDIQKVYWDGVNIPWIKFKEELKKLGK